MVQRRACSMSGRIGDGLYPLSDSWGDVLDLGHSVMGAGIEVGTGGRTGFIGTLRSSSFSAISGSFLVSDRRRMSF
jgi:hypothetical protein